MANTQLSLTEANDSVAFYLDQEEIVMIMADTLGSTVSVSNIHFDKKGAMPKLIQTTQTPGQIVALATNLLRLSTTAGDRLYLNVNRIVQYEADSAGKAKVQYDKDGARLEVFTLTLTPAELATKIAAL